MEAITAKSVSVDAPGPETILQTDRLRIIAEGVKPFLVNNKDNEKKLSEIFQSVSDEDRALISEVLRRSSNPVAAARVISIIEKFIDPLQALERIIVLLPHTGVYRLNLSGGAKVIELTEMAQKATSQSALPTEMVDKIFTALSGRRFFEQVGTHDRRAIEAAKEVRVHGNSKLFS